MNDESRFRHSRRQQHHETIFRKKTKLHRQIHNHIKQRTFVYKNL